jgi:hypothetical protein
MKFTLPICVFPWAGENAGAGATSNGKAAVVTYRLPGLAVTRQWS